MSGVDPKAKFGEQKPQLHLVPGVLMIAAAKAMAEGAVRYGAYNWRGKKVKLSTYVNGMLRHLLAYIDGEEFDPESAVGKHHLDGLAASLAILLDAKAGGWLEDDRPARGPVPELCRAPKRPGELELKQGEDYTLGVEGIHTPWCASVLSPGIFNCDCKHGR